MIRLLPVLALLCSTAWAQTELDEARIALERGQHQRSLQTLDSYLEKNRGDAEARFLRGLALVMLTRDGEAKQVFADLVRDHPELPEPYNNLAVLYARAGQYEQAKDALETALLKHPSYATAHENLGDIYASMAQAAWTRAATLDRENQTLRAKLDMIGSVVANQAVDAPKLSTPEPETPRPVVVAPSLAPILAPVTQSPSVARLPQTEPVLPQARPDTTPATLSDASAQVRSQVLDTLQDWSSAWSRQDVNAYLAMYSANFSPGRNLSLENWKQQRRARLTAPASISVQVINPVVQAMGADRVRVQFVQVYQSSSYADQVSKVMTLQREAGGWRILSEGVDG